MNLEKAIEISENRNRFHPRVEYPDEWDAIQIGIEAIQRLEDWRAGKILNPSFMLPSETEEYIPRNIGRIPSDENCQKGGTKCT